MVALLSWLLDISSYFVIRSDGSWQLKDKHSLEKTHLLLLLRYAPVSFSLTAQVNSPSGVISGAVGKEAKQERFLISGSVAWAPWNIAFAAASVLATEFAVSLPGGWKIPIAPTYTVAAVSFIGIVLMISSRKQGQRWAVVTGCAALMGFAALWVHIPHLPLAEATWLAVSITYLSFHRLSFVDLIEAIPKLWRTLTDAASSLLEVVSWTLDIPLHKRQKRSAECLRKCCGKIWHDAVLRRMLCGPGNCCSAGEAMAASPWSRLLLVGECMLNRKPG